MVTTEWDRSKARHEAAMPKVYDNTTGEESRVAPNLVQILLQIYLELVKDP